MTILIIWMLTGIVCMYISYRLTDPIITVEDVVTCLVFGSIGGLFMILVLIAITLEHIESFNKPIKWLSGKPRSR